MQAKKTLKLAKSFSLDTDSKLDISFGTIFYGEIVGTSDTENADKLVALDGKPTSLTLPRARSRSTRMNR